MTENGSMTSVAKLNTLNASRYLQQLCKHFRHKRPVEFDPSHGSIEFSVGVCRLDAEGEVLTMTLTGPDEAQMAQLQDVVARHLERFAFREEIKVDWQPA